MRTWVHGYMGTFQAVTPDPNTEYCFIMKCVQCALFRPHTLYRLARFVDGGYRKNRLEFTPEHTVPSASLTLQMVPSSTSTVHASQSHSVQI